MGDELAGHGGAKSDVYLWEVDGLHGGYWHSIHLLVDLQWRKCNKVTVPARSHGGLADSGQSCCEGFSLNSVYAT